MDSIAETEQWLKNVVVGLNLCPFARQPLVSGRVKFVECSDQQEDRILLALEEELHALYASSASTLETTLLITPNAFPDFWDYNLFLNPVDRLIQQLGYEGVFQIASFHPHYVFAGTAENDPTNLTNRSPYPIFHLLREDSLSQVLDRIDGVDDIIERNQQTVQSLSKKQLSELFGYLR